MSGLTLFQRMLIVSEKYCCTLSKDFSLIRYHRSRSTHMKGSFIFGDLIRKFNPRTSIVLMTVFRSLKQLKFCCSLLMVKMCNKSYIGYLAPKFCVGTALFRQSFTGGFKC